MDGLPDELQDIINEKRVKMKEEYDRVLPVNELFSDRWEKAEFLGFGNGSSVYDSCVIIGAVKAGINVWVGPFTLLDGSGGLTIGNNCDISAGAQIYTHDTVRRALSGGETDTQRAPVQIESNCHIGAGSIILKGVTIGHHSVVGAGCVVTKSFPPYSIITGVPGRRTGTVKIDEEGKEIEFVYDKQQTGSAQS